MKMILLSSIVIVITVALGLVDAAATRAASSSASTSYYDDPNFNVILPQNTRSTLSSSSSSSFSSNNYIPHSEKSGGTQADKDFWESVYQNSLLPTKSSYNALSGERVCMTCPITRDIFLNLYNAAAATASPGASAPPRVTIAWTSDALANNRQIYFCRNNTRIQLAPILLGGGGVLDLSDIVDDSSNYNVIGGGSSAGGAVAGGASSSGIEFGSSEMDYACDQNRLCLLNVRHNYPHKYKCLVKSYVLPVQLNVIVQLQYIILYFTGDSVKFDYQKEVIVHENHQFTVKCEVPDTNPVSKVRAYIDQQELKLTNMDSKRVDNRMNIVTYSYDVQAQRHMNGKRIKCEASMNDLPSELASSLDLRSHISKDYLLSVYYLPSCVHKERLYRTGINRSLVIECPINASNPDVTYYKMVPPSSRTKVELVESDLGTLRQLGRFRINPCSTADFGLYECIPRSLAGTAKCDIVVELGAEPNPPEQCQVQLATVNNKTYAQFSCRPGFNQGGLTSFLSIYERVDGELKLSGRVNIDENKMDKEVPYITPADEDKYYEFVLMQENNYGNSTSVLLTLGVSEQQKIISFWDFRTVTTTGAAAFFALFVICLCGCCCCTDVCSSSKSDNPCCKCCFPSDHLDDDLNYKKGGGGIEHTYSSATAYSGSKYGGGGGGGGGMTVSLLSPGNGNNTGNMGPGSGSSYDYYDNTSTRLLQQGAGGFTSSANNYYSGGTNSRYSTNNKYASAKRPGKAVAAGSSSSASSYDEGGNNIMMEDMDRIEDMMEDDEDMIKGNSEGDDELELYHGRKVISNSKQLTPSHYATNHYDMSSYDYGNSSGAALLLSASNSMNRKKSDQRRHSPGHHLYGTPSKQQQQQQQQQQHQHQVESSSNNSGSDNGLLMPRQKQQQQQEKLIKTDNGLVYTPLKNNGGRVKYEELKSCSLDNKSEEDEEEEEEEEEEEDIEEEAEEEEEDQEEDLYDNRMISRQNHQPRPNHNHIANTYSSVKKITKNNDSHHHQQQQQFRNELSLKLALKNAALAEENNKASSSSSSSPQQGDSTSSSSSTCGSNSELKRSGKPPNGNASNSKLSNSSAYSLLKTTINVQPTSVAAASPPASPSTQPPPLVEEPQEPQQQQPPQMVTSSSSASTASSSSSANEKSSSVSTASSSGGSSPVNKNTITPAATKLPPNGKPPILKPKPSLLRQHPTLAHQDAEQQKMATLATTESASSPSTSITDVSSPQCTPQHSDQQQQQQPPPPPQTQPVHHSHHKMQRSRSNSLTRPAQRPPTLPIAGSAAACTKASTQYAHTTITNGASPHVSSLTKSVKPHSNSMRTNGEHQQQHDTLGRRRQQQQQQQHQQQLIQVTSIDDEINNMKLSNGGVRRLVEQPALVGARTLERQQRHYIKNSEI